VFCLAFESERFRGKLPRTVSSRPELGAAPNDRLDGWKEIAVYLSRDVRTVQRWEKRGALPVHRHDTLGTVCAFRSELDEWLRRSSAELERLSQPESVDEMKTAPNPPQQPASASRHTLFLFDGKRIFYWSTSLVALFAVSFGFWAMRRPLSVAAHATTILVLPFESLSADTRSDWLSQGMTEEMITQLGRVSPSRLRIISIAPAAARNSDPLVTGSAFHADFVLHGSVRTQGEQIRIAAQLISVRDRAHVLDDSYDAELGHVLEREAEIAGAIARSVSITVGAGTRARTHPADAERNYFLGRDAWNKRTEPDLRKAITLFQSAIAKDPQYAEAFSGIADSYALLGSAEIGAMPPREAMPQAKEAVLKALQLDDTLAEAHASLGHIALVFDWDFNTARREFDRAIELNPSYATAHQWYGLYHNALGQHEAAVAEVRKAQELEPDSPANITAMSEAHYLARDYTAAEREARRALNLNPNFPIAYLNLGRALEQQGKWQPALDAYSRGRELSGHGPAMSMYVARIFARNQPGKAQSMLDYMRTYRGPFWNSAHDGLSPAPNPSPSPGAKPYISPLYFAGVYTALDDRDNVFISIDKAVEDRCEYLIYLQQEPMADPLRSDPRFTALLQHIGLPAAQLSAHMQ
jgi:TolB-like protein/Tfp pilus assembly protein PilF